MGSGHRATEIVIKRFTSVLFALKSSPVTINHHMNKYKDINADMIGQFLNDLYMDDNITGFEEREDAFEYYLNLKQVPIFDSVSIVLLLSSQKPRRLLETIQIILPHP